MLSLAVILFLRFLDATRAQSPNETSAYLLGCDDWGCFPNYYCQFGNSSTKSLCQRCPAKTDLNIEEACISAAASGVNNKNDNVDQMIYYNQTLQACLASCTRATTGEVCSQDSPCLEGFSFCNYHDESGNSGTCQNCKADTSDCFSDSKIINELGLEECVLCEMPCIPLHTSQLFINHTVVTSMAMQGSPTAATEDSLLVDCTNLIHDDETICDAAVAAATDTGAVICLVEDYTRNTFYVDVVRKCAASGGVGVVFYGDYTPQTSNDRPWVGSLSFQETTIPSVSVSYDNGSRWKQILQDNHTETLVAQMIEVGSNGDACIKQQFCSESVPCLGSNTGRYCDYKFGGGNGGDGFCRSCPVDTDGNPNPLECFFTIGNDTGKTFGTKAVESCSSVCAHSLEFGNCKLCPQTVRGFELGMTSDDGTGEEEESCRLCPENDVQYPQQEFQLFGKGIQCWTVQKFFASVHIPASAPNCQLAQQMNYICGCQGPGYAGASTERKRAILTWAPRATALLSFLGSLFVIYDASKTKQDREKVLNQIMITLSLFDIVGAITYAFTTLPIPENDIIPVYGAKGTDTSCTAQGFFIQIGTISCFTNVSLAFYFLFVIKFGWTEHKLKSYRNLLIFCPIVLGLIFAFAGIPFYGNMILWCNNTASWWPELPVLASIFLATVIMAIVCSHVNKQERVSYRWRFSAAGEQRRGGGVAAGGETLSSQVFWQSLWYLMAFYLTWPPYMTLQYGWAADSYLTNYGLVLLAGLLAPLQGLLNSLVWARPRQIKRMKNRMNTALRTSSKDRKEASGSGSAPFATPVT